MSPCKSAEEYRAEGVLLLDPRQQQDRVKPGCEQVYTVLARELVTWVGIVASFGESNEQVSVGCSG